MKSTVGRNLPHRKEIVQNYFQPSDILVITGKNEITLALTLPLDRASYFEAVMMAGEPLSGRALTRPPPMNLAL
jgi:hypothetical protein